MNFRVDIYLSALFFYAVKKYFIIIICCQSLAKLESALDFDANGNHIMSSRLRNWGWDDDLGLYVFVDNSRYVLPKGVFK